MGNAVRQVITVAGQSGKSKMGASVGRIVPKDVIELNSGLRWHPLTQKHFCQP
jgi:hypothetical protein